MNANYFVTISSYVYIGSEKLIQEKTIDCIFVKNLLIKIEKLNEKLIKNTTFQCILFYLFFWQ